MKKLLYGDGINDDTAAIQEMIDSSCELTLPPPKEYYLISKPLELHSNFKLKLPRFAEIRLAPASNCVMLKNRTQDDYGKRIGSKIFSYVNRYSPDYPLENIEIEGGIWNFNNKNQNPNPISTGKYEPLEYSGFCMLFYNVKNFRMSGITIKDPANFGVTLDKISYFSIHDISFDFNDGNLYQSNMDGLHINGNSHHGVIENIFGTCYDDVVALNAEEGSRGPINDITIRGIYTKGSYSAVRLLSASPECQIRNIHICDVYGSFYHYGISMQHYYDTGARGAFENITIDNVYAEKSDRNLVKFYLVNKYRKFGIIDVESESDVKNLRISNLHRKEFIDNTPTILIFENTLINNLSLENISSENHTENPEMPLLSCRATVNGLYAKNLYEDGKEKCVSSNLQGFVELI